MTKSATVIKLLVAIAAGGLVLAAMMFPVFGGAGIAAKNTAQMIDETAVSFTEEQPALVTTVLAADGSALVHYYNYYRLPIPLDQMGEWAPKAIIAVEDKRFYEHQGVDTQGILRAAVQNLIKGEVSQGASTITQQLVKNTLLYQAKSRKEQEAAVEGSIGRKLREAKIALELERKLTKEQILEKYLNLMNMGAGTYGVKAAALTYFGVEPANLSIDQAALIAGIVQNPTKFNPFNDPQAAKKRRDTVLNLMANQGMITPEQLDVEIKKPITLANGAKPWRSCSEAPNTAGFFCDYVWQYLTGNLGIPESTLKNDGLTIQTTLNPAIQSAATNGILTASSSLKRDPNIFSYGDYRLAMMDVLDVKNGNVLALAMNKKYGNDPNDPGQTNFNYTIAPGLGAGSTYKLFPAVTALEMGTGWNFELTAKEPYQSKIMASMGIDYKVHNASSSYPDKMNLTAALYMSSNTYFVALEDHIGNMNPIVDNAYKMGLWAPNDTKLRDTIKAEQRASFTLGPDLGNPLRLGVAYATVANRGTKCEPVPIVSINGFDGQPVVNPATGQPYFTAGTNCTPEAIPQGVADTINQILLKDVMPGNSGQTGGRAYVPGYQIAGKTGTAQDNVSYAFVGYTPRILASVMAYNLQAQPMPSPGGGEAGYGGGYPAQMWKDAMVNILPLIGNESFPPADPQVAQGKVAPLSVNCVGMTPAKCKAALKAAGYDAVDGGSTVPSTVAAGLVATTSPAPGASIAPGTTVTYYVSNGQAPPGQPCQPGQDPATGCVAPPPAPTGVLCQPGEDPATTGCTPPAPPGQPCVEGQDPATGCTVSQAPAPPPAPQPPGQGGQPPGQGNGRVVWGMLLQGTG